MDDSPSIAWRLRCRLEPDESGRNIFVVRSARHWVAVVTARQFVRGDADDGGIGELGDTEAVGERDVTGSHCRADLDEHLGRAPFGGDHRRIPFSESEIDGVGAGAGRARWSVVTVMVAWLARRNEMHSGDERSGLSDNGGPSVSASTTGLAVASTGRATIGALASTGTGRRASAWAERATAGGLPSSGRFGSARSHPSAQTTTGTASHRERERIWVRHRLCPAVAMTSRRRPSPGAWRSALPFARVSLVARAVIGSGRDQPTDLARRAPVRRVRR